MRIDSDFVKNCALGRWRDILLFLAPHLHQIINLDKHHGPCPLCGGKDRCRCFNDFENTGGIICNQCGGGANGLDVLMWANGWGFSEAFKAVVSYLGLTTNLLPIIRKHMPKQKEWYGKRKQLDKIWSESQADVKRMRDYFEYRGLKRSFSGTLRFHPNLPYYHNDKTVTYHPAMLAQIICGVDVVGMHRTYLDSDGPGKAPVSSPKKTIKCADTMSGGSIRLFEPELGKPLVLCEGIETALAIHSYTDWPVWPCVSSTMLEKVLLPDSIRFVFIGADKDLSGAGQVAAEKLSRRLVAEGRVVQISLPPMEIPEGSKSVDWLDYQTQEMVYG